MNNTPHNKFCLNYPDDTPEKGLGVKKKKQQHMNRQKKKQNNVKVYSFSWQKIKKLVHVKPHQKLLRILTVTHSTNFSVFIKNYLTASNKLDCIAEETTVSLYRPDLTKRRKHTKTRATKIKRKVCFETWTDSSNWASTPEHKWTFHQSKHRR